ncbi:BrxA family protein [Ferruginibacter sp. SUN106]|uniref:BrxA family protein n=1 Tax=Ferruginibacter sp. SUN106 TaxID=2978348 RepID=UPI003D366CF8
MEQKISMEINSDINILGGLPDLSLISYFLGKDRSGLLLKEDHHTYTSIKTDKSVKRFEKAIFSTFLKFKNSNIELIISSMLNQESISSDSLILLFWNSSYNNDVLKYLNENLYFVSFYSGRITIKQDDVIACLKDLKEREIELKKWSDSTLKITASKYLTLLKKFHLMEGALHKTIVHPYLNDKMFILFVYWITAIESKQNLMESKWLKYSFCERPLFIERVLQKKFSKYFQLQYTGDKLNIETSIPYENIYHAIK